MKRYIRKMKKKYELGRGEQIAIPHFPLLLLPPSSSLRWSSETGKAEGGWVSD